MIARAARPLVKLALLGLVLWIAQRAWTRWVNGPDVVPASRPWPPVSGTGDAQTGGASRSTPTAGETDAPTSPAPGAASSAPDAASSAPDAASSPPTNATEAKAAAPAKRAAKKTVAGSKTAPGKIVAAKKTRSPAKKAAPASGAAPAAARIVPAEKRESAGSKWLPPHGDECPPTHPVKAKIASMIYHLPGMASYVRTTPDRCYATAEDAEADGFARAKR